MKKKATHRSTVAALRRLFQGKKLSSNSSFQLLHACMGTPLTGMLQKQERGEEPNAFISPRHIHLRWRLRDTHANNKQISKRREERCTCEHVP